MTPLPFDDFFSKIIVFIQWQSYIYKKINKINSNKIFSVQVYDTTGLQELLFSDEVQVKIESYDVLIDITFLNSESKFINFDKIKVEQTVSKIFSIKNKGNYAIAFR